MRHSTSVQKFLRLIQSDIQQISDEISAGMRSIPDAIRQHKDAEQERYEAQRKQQGPSEVAGIRDAIESIAQTQGAAYATKKWYKDRTFLVSVAGVLVVGAYTLVTACQLRNMNSTYKEIQKQSTTASRQLEMADRPWLKDEIKSASDFTFQNGTAVWAISIKSQNIGHSVATETFSEVRMIAIHNADMLDGPRKKVTEICESMPKRFEYVKAIPGLWNNSIFPNDSHETVANVILSPKDIGDTLDGGNSLGKSMIPVLVGCLEYRYPTSDKPHHTGFVYVLSHNENPSIAEAGRTFFSVGQNIAKDNVVLRKFGQVAD
jgi:hypothetical protein